MESQVVTLETARKLKEAGFPQGSSYLVWYESKSVGPTVVRREVNGKDLAAPTAQDIADELPDSVPHEFPNCLELSKGAEWSAEYSHIDDDIVVAYGPTIAEALASLYLKLRSNND